MKKILLTAIQYPDTDGVSSALAYQSYLAAKDLSNDYIAAFEGGLHVEPRFVCDQLKLGVKILNGKTRFDEFILLDASERAGLPKQLRLNDVTEVIDHRMFSDFAAFPRAKFRVEPVGAAATLIAEFFYFDRSINLSTELAALLLCGIYSNTVIFQSDTSTARDLRMRDWLTSMLPKKYSDLPHRMYEFKSRYTLDNIEEVLKDDAKDNCVQFRFEEPAVIFQIETALVEPLLEQEARLLTNMGKLFPDRKYKLLIIQDAKNTQTFLLSDSEKVHAALKGAKLDLQDTSSPLLKQLPNIVMRKSVMKAINESTH